MGYFKNKDIEIQEIERGDALARLENLNADLDAELNDPHNEFGNLNFDDADKWWFEQDQEMVRLEDKHIEAMAEEQENRNGGYWR